MTILGIETSGDSASVALMHGDCCASRTLPSGGRRHARSLVPEIDALFRDQGIDRRDCSAVAVSIGPGSFTGLRVGVVCAKIWAWAANCDLVAVDTFLAVAENSPPGVAEVSVIADAQRGDLYVGRYVRIKGRNFRRDGEITIVNGETWSGGLTPSHNVSGPIGERWSDILRHRCRLADPAVRHPNAVGIVKIGASLLLEGEVAQVRTLEPFYLRRSAAEEKWDAAQRKSTTGD